MRLKRSSKRTTQRDTVAMVTENSGTAQFSPKQSSKTLESPEISQNKRLKTLALTLDSPLPALSSSKGKAKIEDESSTVDSESETCGICLSDDVKAIRGWVDSCHHYFCFVCITEWAKVESRCPICKRRFTTIRRPPKEGLFLSERVVNVPVRDQVYHYFGNATIGPPYPYSEVKCSVCHSTTDECLLLLCDLCDSAAHTFCVGLGATVPEGDWFCQDCTLLRAEHAKSETDANFGNPTTFRNPHKMPSAEANMSIFDIVRESSFAEVRRPPMIVSSNPSQLSSLVVRDGGIGVAGNITVRGSRTHPSVACNATELSARTLGRCRNVHGRIRALRENWNGFRSGSLRFSSDTVDCGAITDKKHNIGNVLCGRSGQPQSMSCSSQQLTVQKGSSCDILHKRDSYDIDKAWKMMAKSIKQDHERSSIVHLASKHPSRKVNVPKETGNMRSTLLASNSKQLGTEHLENIGLEKQHQFQSLEKDNDKHNSQIFGKQKQGRVTTTGVSKYGESFPTSSPDYWEFPFSRKVQASVQVDFCHQNGGKLPQENLPGAPSNVFNEHDGAACLFSPVGSLPIPSNTSCTKLELHPFSSSSCKMEPSKGKGRIVKSCGDNKARRDDGAKSEIQSLVKLNLKLLSRHKKLEVDVFKEVARLATHSILAACGLECPKPGVCSFPSSVCCHADEVRQLRKSTLMPSSCRECFYVFVKDVVNTIVFEKTASVEMSC